MIKVELKAKRLQRTISKTTQILNHNAKVMNDVSLRLKNYTKRTLDSQKSPDGRAWKKLKPATIARKGHSKILFDTGKLRNTMRRTWTDKFAENAASVNYAEYHERHTETRPRRHLWGVSKKFLKEISEYILRVYMRAWK